MQERRGGGEWGGAYLKDLSFQEAGPRILISLATPAVSSVRLSETETAREAASPRPSVQSWFLIPAVGRYPETHDCHCLTVSLNRTAPWPLVAFGEPLGGLHMAKT